MYFSHHIMLYNGHWINLCCVLHYEIASHIQTSKNVFLFQILLLICISLMYENTTIVFNLTLFSSLLQKDTLGICSGKIIHAYSKGLAQFC